MSKLLSFGYMEEEEKKSPDDDSSSTASYSVHHQSATLTTYLLHIHSNHITSISDHI